MTTRVDKIIDKMWVALRKPATTVAEIAERVSAAMGEEISTATINSVLAILRKDAWNDQKYGWTVPHVKRGIPVPGDPIDDDGDDGRFIRCLVDRDGSYYFDDNDAAMINFDRGEIATLQQIVTLSHNSICMLQARVANTRSIKMRAKLNDTLKDYEYAARKAEIILDDLRTA